MQRLVIYDAANEYILSTPLYQRDEAESEKRCTKIFEEKLEAQPPNLRSEAIRRAVRLRDEK